MKTLAKSIGTMILPGVVLLLSISACGPSLVIENVDYAQPLESVITPDTSDVIYDQRYGIQFSIEPLLTEEGLTSVNEVRMIRNNLGYYFITASGFSNVYVLQTDEGELSLQRKIAVNGNTLEQPVFNQRGDFIELVDLSTQQVYQLNAEGLLTTEDAPITQEGIGSEEL